MRYELKRPSFIAAVTLSALLLTALGPALGSAPALARSGGASPRSDAVLRRVRAALPRHWRLRIKPGRVIVERTRKVWANHCTNRISAYARHETAAQRARRIKTYGYRATPRIIFRAVGRWSVQKLSLTRKHNAKVNRMIRTQRQHLRGGRIFRQSIRLRPGLSPAMTRTERKTQRKTERKRWKAYRAAVKRLRRQILELPSYHTRTFSLFFPTYEGWSDSFHEIHPQKAVRECHALDQKIRKLLISVRP